MLSLPAYVKILELKSREDVRFCARIRTGYRPETSEVKGPKLCPRARVYVGLVMGVLGDALVSQTAGIQQADAEKPLEDL